MKSREILTTGEAAQWCGVHFRTVLRWCERGVLASYKLPGRGDRRIRVEDFLGFLRQNRMPIPIQLRPSGRRVLVVDDDAAVVKMVTKALQVVGFETEQASDGFSAGAKLMAFMPAVMTLDLEMPGLRGEDVIRFVRNTPDLASTKILVVSALSSEELEGALKLGADDFLQKPVDYKVLQKRVAALAGVELPAKAEKKGAAP
jgi:excisionase family DNA binding protein